LDVVFQNAQGQEQRVPAFWAGGSVWTVRYASPAAGRYKFRSVCNDASNSDLHGRTGELEVVPDTSKPPTENLLYRHGPVRMADDRRHFQHADGTPFFWLGDTWWMGLTK